MSSLCIRSLARSHHSYDSLFLVPIRAPIRVPIRKHIQTHHFKRQFTTTGRYEDSSQLDSAQFAGRSPQTKKAWMESMSKLQSEKGNQKELGGVLWDNSRPGAVYVIHWDAAGRQELYQNLRHIPAFLTAKFLLAAQCLLMNIYTKKEWGSLFKRATWKAYPKTTSKELVAITTDYYKQINEAYVSKRPQDVSEICGASLMKTLKNRLARRKMGQTYEWSLRNWETPVLLSRVTAQTNMGGILLIGEQAILECKSTQIVRRGIQNIPSVEWEPEISKKVHEYVVLQRRIIDLKVKDNWYLWGFLNADTHVVTIGKYVKWKNAKKTENTKLMETLTNQHPSHKTVQQIMQ